MSRHSLHMPLTTMAVRHRLVKPRTLVLSPLGWGSLGELRRRGMARTQVDMLIAATALGQRLPLVAHNVRDRDPAAGRDLAAA